MIIMTRRWYVELDVGLPVEAARVPAVLAARWPPNRRPQGVRPVHHLDVLPFLSTGRLSTVRKALGRWSELMVWGGDASSRSPPHRATDHSPAAAGSPRCARRTSVRWPPP
jgi:hypothetical protein